jgi:hypothetical protein
MPDVLVRHLEQYFCHPGNDHDVLNVGDKAVACSNLRQALEMLGVDSHLSPCSTSLSRSFLLGLRTVMDLTKELVCVRCVALSHSPSLSS